MGMIFRRVVFWVIFFSIYLVSLLPLTVLFAIAHVFFLFSFYIFGYRKSVVIQNLSRSFPNKKYEEIQIINKQFFRDFAAHFAEIIKFCSIQPRRLKKHIELSGFDALTEHTNQGRNIIACLGHCGNWEILNILPQSLPFDVYAVYKPLKNKIFGMLINHLRSRFGMNLISSKCIAKHILSKRNQSSLYLFIADQCPKTVDKEYVFPFLNQQTAMFPGVEKLARASNAVVVYLHIVQKSRGYYEMKCIPICSDAAETDKKVITKKYASLLEQNIIEQPRSWLWTHKRWKR